LIKLDITNAFLNGPWNELPSVLVLVTILNTSVEYDTCQKFSDIHKV